jgi:hypothetical protein
MGFASKCVGKQSDNPSPDGDKEKREGGKGDREERFYRPQRRGLLACARQFTKSLREHNSPVATPHQKECRITWRLF